MIICHALKEMRRQERRAGLDILKMSAAHVSFILTLNGPIPDKTKKLS